MPCTPFVTASLINKIGQTVLNISRGRQQSSYSCKFVPPGSVMIGGKPGDRQEDVLLEALGRDESSLAASAKLLLQPPHRTTINHCGFEPEPLFRLVDRYAHLRKLPGHGVFEDLAYDPEQEEVPALKELTRVLTSIRAHLSPAAVSPESPKQPMPEPPSSSATGDPAASDSAGLKRDRRAQKAESAENPRVMKDCDLRAMRAMEWVEKTHPRLVPDAGGARCTREQFQAIREQWDDPERKLLPTKFDSFSRYVRRSNLQVQGSVRDRRRAVPTGSSVVRADQVR